MLAAAIAATVAALTGCSGDPQATQAVRAGTPAATVAPSRPVSDVRVGIVFSDPSVAGSPSQAAASALQRATTDFGIRSKAVPAEVDETDQAKARRLTDLARQGYDPVIAIGRSYAQPLLDVAAKLPKTQFAIVDGPPMDVKNVTRLVYDEVQGAFLAGTIAAQATRTKKIGFIGGWRVPQLESYAKGFEQGAAAVDPDITMTTQWLSEDGSGFQDPDRARSVATQLFKQGTDVVYTVSLYSNPGVFTAAARQDALAIGMDTDEYAAASSAQKPAIITSVVKKADTVVYAMIKSAVDGDMLTGDQTFGVKQGAIALSTSNPAVQPYEATADEFAQKLATGTLKVKR